MFHDNFNNEEFKMSNIINEIPHIKMIRPVPQKTQVMFIHKNFW